MRERLAKALSCGDSLMHLHSATASVLLRSKLASEVGQWGVLYEGVKKNNPGIAFTEVGKVVGERWNKLSAVKVVRYATEDPTLPKPWRGLIDGNTGYLYFWNPETNVTQYERPALSILVAPTSSAKSTSPSVHAQKCYLGQVGDASSNDNEDSCDRNGNGVEGNLDPGSGIEFARTGSDHPHDNPKVVDDRVVKQNFTSSGCGLSLEEYRCRHEITVSVRSDS